MLLTLAVLAGAGGCGVERQMRITSEPDGALVYLNDEEVGRTPLTRDFVWYGNYDVQLRKEGYEAVQTNSRVIAPWWQWPPFDFVAELLPLPLRDTRELHYTMRETTSEQESTDVLLQRAADMRGMLQSGRATNRR